MDVELPHITAEAMGKGGAGEEHLPGGSELFEECGPPRGVQFTQDIVNDHGDFRLAPLLAQ